LKDDIILIQKVCTPPLTPIHPSAFLTLNKPAIQNTKNQKMSGEKIIIKWFGQDLKISPCADKAFSGCFKIAEESTTVLALSALLNQKEQVQDKL